MKDNILKSFNDMYKKNADGYTYAGGRFELLGNHVDHNHGMTLASTCSLIIEGAFSKEANNVVRFYSKGNCDFTISLDNTNVVKEEIGKSFFSKIGSFFGKIANKIKESFRARRERKARSMEVDFSVFDEITRDLDEMESTINGFEKMFSSFDSIAAKASHVQDKMNALSGSVLQTGGYSRYTRSYAKDDHTFGM